MRPSSTSSSPGSTSTPLSTSSMRELRRWTGGCGVRGRAMRRRLSRLPMAFPLRVNPILVACRVNGVAAPESFRPSGAAVRLGSKSTEHPNRSTGGGGRPPPHPRRGAPPRRGGGGMTATEEVPVATRAAGTVDAVKIYGQGTTEVRALDGVTVSFQTARFTAIMGPSGSGKSTLLHCVAGLDTLSSGQAFIGDTDLSELDDNALTILGASRWASCSRRTTSCRRSPRTRTSGSRSCSAAARAMRSGSTASSTRSASGPAPPPAERAVGWAAAAGGRRPGAGEPAADHLRRRADGQPRLARVRRSSTSCGWPCTSSARRS